MRKGVSELIGIVLLVAFVLGVAGIVSAWITDYGRESTENVDEKRESLCFNVDVRFLEDSLEYDSNSLNVTIENYGKEEVFNFSIYYVKEMDVVQGDIISGQRNETNTLKRGQQERLITTGNTTSIQKLKIVPGNCPSGFYEREVE